MLCLRGGDIINLSEKLEFIIYILEQCRLDAQWYESRLKDEEKKENNIRHEMEGVASDSGLLPKFKQRAVLATQWQNILIARRIAKDNLTINLPVAEFIDSDIGREALNKLKQKLGEVRKIEKGMLNRKYYKRKTDESSDDPEKNQRLNRLINEWKRGLKN